MKFHVFVGWQVRVCSNLMQLMNESVKGAYIDTEDGAKKRFLIVYPQTFMRFCVKLQYISMIKRLKMLKILRRPLCDLKAVFMRISIIQLAFITSFLLKAP